MRAVAKAALEPTIESPTWGHVVRMAKEIQAKLYELAPQKAGDNGPKRGAADVLSWESFYTLSILSSLMVEGSPRAEALSKQKVIPDEKPKKRKKRKAK